MIHLPCDGEDHRAWPVRRRWRPLTVRTPGVPPSAGHPAYDDSGTGGQLVQRTGLSLYVSPSSNEATVMGSVFVALSEHVSYEAPLVVKSRGAVSLSHLPGRSPMRMTPVGAPPASLPRSLSDEYERSVPPTFSTFIRM